MKDGALVGGRYVAERRLDRGGANEVWLTRDRTTGISVALKLSDRPAAPWPTHPNLVRILDEGSHGGRHYTVMALVPGRTLAAILAEGPLARDTALLIQGMVASALEALHDRGLVHADLRPANVMVGPDGSVTLLDPEDPSAIRASDDGVALASLRRSLGLDPKDVS